MLIKNAIILSPGTHEQYSGDIRIANGIITEIIAHEASHRHERALSSLPAGQTRDLPGSGKAGQNQEEILDASGCVAAPGLIDVHVHFRDPGQTWKEDLHTGSLAAAAGGFTSVVCMANTRPPIDHTKELSDLIMRAKDERIRVHFAAAVTKGLNGQELTDFSALAKAGACGFTDDGMPLLNELLVEKAMLDAQKLGLPLSFHEEHPAFIKKSGANCTAPAIAEDILVARDCMLALHTGAVINIQHISSANSAALVRTAKALGAQVFAEAAPHHFSLTEDALRSHGTLAKMNPPLRTEADRLAIIKGLQDGTIDLIATDHAPHSTAEKQKEDFFAAPSGIIGLETALALGITNLVRPGHLTLMQLLEKMTVGPARLYCFDALAQQNPALRTALRTPDRESAEAYGSHPGGGVMHCTERTAAVPDTDRLNSSILPDCAEGRDFGSHADRLYGSILPGCAADLVIFDPEESFTAGSYLSKSSNSPFTGMKLYGKIRCTICGGRVVYQGHP